MIAKKIKHCYFIFFIFGATSTIGAHALPQLYTTMALLSVVGAQAQGEIFFAEVPDVDIYDVIALDNATCLLHRNSSGHFASWGPPYSSYRNETYLGNNSYAFVQQSQKAPITSLTNVAIITNVGENATNSSSIILPFRGSDHEYKFSFFIDGQVNFQGGTYIVPNEANGNKNLLLYSRHVATDGTISPLLVLTDLDDLTAQPTIIFDRPASKCVLQNINSTKIACIEGSQIAWAYSWAFDFNTYTNKFSRSIWPVEETKDTTSTNLPEEVLLLQSLTTGLSAFLTLEGIYGIAYNEVTFPPNVSSARKIDSYDDYAFFVGEFNDEHPTFFIVDRSRCSYTEAGNNCTIYLWPLLNHQGYLGGLSVSPNGERLVMIGGSDQSALLLEANLTLTLTNYADLACHGYNMPRYIFSSILDHLGTYLAVTLARITSSSTFHALAVSDRSYGYGGTNLEFLCPRTTESPTIFTQVPSYQPSITPTLLTQAPTFFPTDVPTSSPTEIPTQSPTEGPLQAPTQVPTIPPTSAPSQAPTVIPTQLPTAPSHPPTAAPQGTQKTLYQKAERGMVWSTFSLISLLWTGGCFWYCRRRKQQEAGNFGLGRPEVKKEVELVPLEANDSVKPFSQETISMPSDTSLNLKYQDSVRL